MSCWRNGRRKRNGSHLHATPHSHEPRGAERGRAASSREAEGLADDVLAVQGFLGQGTVRFENQANGFGEVRASFLEGFSLGIGPRELLNEADVALLNLLEDRCEL